MLDVDYVEDVEEDESVEVDDVDDTDPVDLEIGSDDEAIDPPEDWEADAHADELEGVIVTEGGAE